MDTLNPRSSRLRQRMWLFLIGACLVYTLPAKAIAQDQVELRVLVNDAEIGGPVENATLELHQNGQAIALGSTGPDGRFSFTVIVVSTEEIPEYIGRIGSPFPNPATTKVSVPLELEAAGNVDIDIIDILGRQIIGASKYLSAGKHTVSVNLGGASPGTYFARVRQSTVVSEAVKFSVVTSSPGRPSISFSSSEVKNSGSSGVGAEGRNIGKRLSGSPNAYDIWIRSVGYLGQWVLGNDVTVTSDLDVFITPLSNLQATTGLAVSDDSGVIQFRDDFLEADIEIAVADESGQAIEGYAVRYYSNGERAWAYAVHPDGLFYPSSDVVDIGAGKSPDIVTIAIVGAEVTLIATPLRLLVAQIQENVEFFPDESGYDETVLFGSMDDLLDALENRHWNEIQVGPDALQSLGLEPDDSKAYRLFRSPELDRLDRETLRQSLIDSGLPQDATYSYGYYDYSESTIAFFGDVIVAAGGAGGALENQVEDEFNFFIIDATPPSDGTPFEVAFNSIGMKLVLIPVGTFQMGSNTFTVEQPVHSVSFTEEFWIGRYEVTQDQYRAVTGQSPSSFIGSKRPVESISWLDAVEFANALSQAEGLTSCYDSQGNIIGASIYSCAGYRLPTEAELEYVTRAGTTTEYSYGNDEGQIGQYAWYIGNSNNRTHPVGEKLPNPWGLYDIHGNTFEWAHDWFSDTYYNESPLSNPTGPESGSLRAARNGGYNFPANDLRSASRGRLQPTDRLKNLGFRLARKAN